MTSGFHQAPPKGGQGCLMLSAGLESWGYHLIPLSHLLLLFFCCFLTLLCPLWKIWITRAAVPIPIVYSILFLCVQTKPVFGTFNLHTDVDLCDCTQGLYGQHEGVCTES